MILFIFLTVLTIFPFFTFGMDIDDLVIRDNTYYKPLSNNPFSGEVTDRDINDNLIMKGNIKNGKKSGQWEYLYTDGVLEIYHLKSGLLHGPHKAYNISGTLIRDHTYKITNGKSTPVGLWTNYDDNGMISKKVFFNSVGLKQGSEEIYTNGLLKIKKHYKNGVPHGTDEMYYDDGSLMSSICLIDGIYQEEISLCNGINPINTDTASN